MVATFIFSREWCLKALGVRYLMSHSVSDGPTLSPVLPARWDPLHPDRRTVWAIVPPCCLHDRRHRKLAVQFCCGPSVSLRPGRSPHLSAGAFVKCLNLGWELWNLLRLDKQIVNYTNLTVALLLLHIVLWSHWWSQLVRGSFKKLVWLVYKMLPLLSITVISYGKKANETTVKWVAVSVCRICHICDISDWVENWPRRDTHSTSCMLVCMRECANLGSNTCFVGSSFPATLSFFSYFRVIFVFWTSCSYNEKNL